MKNIRIFKSGIHLGEEPIVSGNHASGLVSFSGCHLTCNFCYTPETSVEHLGDDYSQEDFKKLVDDLVMRGARNLNLISPTHVWNHLIRPLTRARVQYGKLLPVISKVSGFESLSTVRSMAGLSDILVPDFKVWGAEEAASVTLPRNYGETAKAAIALMMESHGESHFTESGKLSHGLLVRHLMMPGNQEDSLNVVQALADIRYRGYVNFMTYFIDGKNKKVMNATPYDVHVLAGTAEQHGMKVLVNGKPYALFTRVHAVPMKGELTHAV